MQGTKLSLVFV